MHCTASDDDDDDDVDDDDDDDDDDSEMEECIFANVTSVPGDSECTNLSRAFVSSRAVVANQTGRSLIVEIKSNFEGDEQRLVKYYF